MQDWSASLSEEARGTFLYSFWRPDTVQFASVGLQGQRSD